MYASTRFTLSRRRLLGALALLLAAAWATGPAAATTGVAPLSKPPIFHVTRVQAQPFLGRFELSAHGRGLISGSLVTGYDAGGYLQGDLAIYAYNGAGQEISWVAATYEYHYLGAAMQVDVWSPDGGQLLGRLRVRLAAGHELTGELTFGAHSESVTFSPAAPGRNIYSTELGSVSATPVTASSTSVTVGIFSVAFEDAQNMLALKAGG